MTAPLHHRHHMDIQIATATLVGFCAALVRTSAWIAICPPFNSPAIPVRIRIGLATAVSFVIAAQIGAEIDDLSLGSFVITLLMQAVAGFALGFAVYMLFAAIQAAGDLIDLQVGFSLGAVLDPISGNMAAPIGRFHQLMAITLLFAINGHILVMQGFLRSVEAVPMGRLDFGILAAEFTELLSAFLIAAVEIGLPVLAALFCTEVALGLLGKAAPQLNILVLGFAAKTFVAIGLLGLNLALLPETTESLFGRAIRAVGRMYGG